MVEVDWSELYVCVCIREVTCLGMLIIEGEVEEVVPWNRAIFIVPRTRN